MSPVQASSLATQTDLEVVQDLTINIVEEISVSEGTDLRPPAVISVNESIGLADLVGMSPSVAIDVFEVVGVSDIPGLFPPANVLVEESLLISDLERVIPSVSIEFVELIEVFDGATALPPAELTISEQLLIAEASDFLPSAVVMLTEQISVTDQPTMVPPATLAIEEYVVANDQVRLLPEAWINLSEAVLVSDDVFLLPDAIIEVTETITILDLPDLTLETDLAFAIGRFRCDRPNSNIPVTIFSVPSFDATRIDHTTVRFGREGTEASETHTVRRTGEIQRHEADVDEDGDLDLLFHFAFEETGLTCEDTEATLTGMTFDGADIAGTGMIQLEDGPPGRVASPFDIMVEPVDPMIQSSKPAQYTVRVSDMLAGQVAAFACEDLPRYASCRFSPSTLQVGETGGAVSLTVIPMRRSTAPLPLGELPPWSLVALLLLAASGILYASRLAPRPRVAWIALVVIGSTVLFVACSDQPTGAEAIGPRSGSYEFTVKAVSGTVELSTEVTLDVE